MAFLFKCFKKVRGRKVLASPFWYIEHRDPARIKLSGAGRVIPVREVTPFRIENALETAKARELEAEMILRERTVHSARDKSQWQLWVIPFIEDIVTGTSRERYLDAWRMIEMWLAENKILFPAQLTYPVASSYVAWREKPDPANRKFAVRRATANYEFKLLRRIMRQAVRAGFCSGNITREVELRGRKDQPRILKPALTDLQLQDVWRAVNHEPEPRRTCFQRAFAIALLHGVRLNETNPNPQTDLRLEDDIPAIKFLQKGSRVRWKPLHPQLLPFFRNLRAQGQRQTFPLGRDEHGELLWNTAWHNFFTHKPADELHFKQREGLAHIGFHCLRVTVNNVLREAGIAKEVREAYLTHEHDTSDDINAQYDRVKLRELLACHAPLQRDWLVVE